MHQFTVSEARTAIACPRIFYFDEQRFRRNKPKYKRVTQIWTDSSASVAGCGKLFHDTIEKFNANVIKFSGLAATLDNIGNVSDQAARAEQVIETCKRFINRYCLNRQQLNAKSPPQQKAFVAAIDQYVREIASVLALAIGEGRAADELIREFFGDNRKRVDVTFNVAAGREPVRVRGALDYIYFDYRKDAKRIVDFKLLPPVAISKDLMQVALYALMHDRQHSTRPDVAVLYLPTRTMEGHTWQKVHDDRFKAYDLLASMAGWADYNEQNRTGLKPPGEPALCKNCPWNRRSECENRLGPKVDGERSQHWSQQNSEAQIEPKIERREPPEPPPVEEFDDADESDVADEPTPPASQASDELLLGATSAGNRPVVLPLDTLNTHVSIMGAAGSGKTWLAKVVAEEAIAQGVPVLAIDPQGDLVQYLYSRQLSEEELKSHGRRQAAMRQRAEVRIWTPGTSHGQRLCLSPLRLSRMDELRGYESDKLREEEWEAMLGVAAGNLVQLAQAGGDSELQETFVMQVLRKLMGDSKGNQPLGLAEIIATLDEPVSLGIDDADRMISSVNRKKLTQKLYSRLKGPSANLFTGGVALDLDRFVNPIEASKTPLNVVYLNAMANDAQKQYFVAALAAEIYRWMITSASASKVRLLVYLDEAKDFLPAGAGKPPAKTPLLRLFAQGRKFGVSCLICTQSPRSVDYNTFTNSSTKLIGRLEAAQDVQRVTEWFSDGSGVPGWLPGRKNAANGSMIGRWPGIPTELEGQEFRSRPLYSLHEKAWSPERVEAEWRKQPLAKQLGELS